MNLLRKLLLRSRRFSLIVTGWFSEVDPCDYSVDKPSRGGGREDDLD